MRNKAERFNKAKLIFVSLVATLAVVIASLIAALITLNHRTAVAASGGSITVHVYDPAGEYNKLGGWFWVKGGGKSHDVSIGKEPLANEQFAEGDNAARPFEFTIDDTELTALKNGSDFGMLVNIVKNANATQFDDKFIKETQDVFVTLKDALDENNHADVYYVRKDSVAYTNINDAKEALVKIVGARFDSVSGKNVTVSFETTKKLETSTTVQIFNGEAEKALASVKQITLSGDKFGGKATLKLPSDFDYTMDYRLKVGNIKAAAAVAKAKLIDTTGFISKFETTDVQNQEYGAILDTKKGNTTFRVWAPFATAVNVRLYKNGDTAIEEEPEELEMKKRNSKNWGGVWELTVKENLANRYYTYAITNYGAVTETIDPYAKAAGVNGDRGMVVDLAQTNPDGWENDKHLYTLNKTAADIPIVYELQVKDFSSSPTSGMQYKGKYLAFTEKGTTVPGDPTLKTGVDYLKDLGITYVHLNPIYDYSSVDERTAQLTGSREDFNWGYDPQNYNVPDGSLSTNPYDGNVRINELKQMIMALHEAGIGVIMDVVYNHTYATAGQAFHDTVPHYYHRTNADGSFANGTGCGNETASERSMMRKFMVESVKYWAEEYHIDGFRFDLMGIHDRTTMKTIRSELDKLSDNGSKVLMYGEPWGGYGYQSTASFSARMNSTKSAISGTGKYTSNTGNKQFVFVYYDNEFSTNGERLATFNDAGRDGLRGGNDLPGGLGWIGGDEYKRSAVQKMIEGGVGDGDGKTTLNATQHVAYACAHDNYTLWDQIVNKNAGTTKLTAYDNPDATMIRMNETVSSAVLMSSGISFMLAGEEFGRTKYGNHDSYNSSAKLNAIDWTRQKAFKNLVEHYKKVIKVRKAYPEYFSYFTAATDKTKCYSYNVNYAGGAFMGVRPSSDYTEATNMGGNLRYIFNPTDSPISVNTAGYTVYVANGSTNPGNGVTTLQPKSALIMGIKKV